jgi:hypothetical protein
MKTLLLSIFIVLLGNIADAQIVPQNFDSTKMVVLTKHDGVQFSGYVLSVNEREYLMKTVKYGKMVIPKHEVRDVVEINSSYVDYEGNIRIPYRMASRYFFTTSAYNLEKKNNYLHMTWFALLEGEFGISKNFSLGVMTTWVGIPIAITPKLSFKISDKFRLGAGGLLGTLSYVRMGYGAGLAYGVATYGSTDYNASLQAGYGFAWTDDGAEGYESVILGVGANVRIGRSAMFVFDSILLPGEDTYIIMPGVRWMTKKNQNYWGLGLASVITDGSSMPIPFPALQYTHFFRE